ncbi:MAG: hypothetical protein ACE5R6_17105 [Candidatus Heimdallarchaeota archaeon]
MAQKEQERERNTKRVRHFFHEHLKNIYYEGVFGVANFNSVYQDLLPIQQVKLKELCQFQFQKLIQQGSIISVGIAYPESVIDCINVKRNGMLDKTRWNVYAREYQKLNRLLNDISRKIANHFGGIPVPATLEGFANEVNHVEEYYGHTISHRVGAEHAGLGWRGKNELIVHEQYSCALRFASIITTLPLLQGIKRESLCENCRACLEICSILKKKARLKNYRENCRKYIIALGLEDEVCGKCIWACYRQSIFKDQFKLKK